MRFTLRSLHIFTIVLLFASLAACSKKNPTPAMYMSWTVNGKPEKATTFTAVLIGGTDVVTSGTYSVTSNGRPTGVYLVIPNAVGTYTLTSTSDKIASYIVPDGPNLSRTSDGTSGAIIVTSVMKKGTVNTIVGTFTFTGSDGVSSTTVTDGKFSFNFD